MANLEVQIGADSSQLSAEINKVEKELRKLENKQATQLKIGADTTSLQKSIDAAKTKLDGLKKSADSMAQSFSNSQKPISGASNTLTQFSRIAQDAPFGIMGIGNNLTATAEAFSNLSKSSGGAGNALKAVASSLMGGGGILLAISLVTTGLTLMSQQGLTVGDVFDKITGKFDETKKALSDINKEVAKTTAEEIFNLKALVSVAQDDALSREKRLIAVKKLQDEYPAYFGNLSTERILNGNLVPIINEVANALKAKAKAQALSGKLTDLAVKELDVREKEAAQVKEINVLIAEINKLKKRGEDVGFFNEASLESQRSKLRDTRKELKALITERDRWAAMGEVEVKKSIDLDADPVKVKKPKKAKAPKKAAIDNSAMDLILELAAERKRALELIQPVELPPPFIIPAMDEKFKAMLDSMKAFNDSAKSIITGSIAETFGQLGTSIGEALASGGNVLAAIGTSILQGLGNFLSDMGGLLIQYGTLAVVKGTLDTAILAGGPLSIAAGLAAIGVGTALKAAGGAIGSFSKSGGSASSPSVSAGNSVSSPTSSVNSSSSGSGWGNVVFEISGQSLVGVLSNTLNKNTKLGGAMPAI